MYFNKIERIIVGKRFNLIKIQKNISELLHYLFIKFLTKPKQIFIEWLLKFRNRFSSFWKNVDERSKIDSHTRIQFSLLILNNSE